ncbi:Hypothetical protein EIN_396000, partial [Entamoeba invadens IP1]
MFYINSILNDLCF